MSYDESVPEITMKEALYILVSWDHVKREIKLAGDASATMEKAPVEVKKACDGVVQLMAKAKICE